MRTTLFLIPAEFLGVPVFGIGWLLGVWILLGIVSALWMLRRPSAGRELVGSLPVFVIVAAVIAFMLPNLVELGPNGKPLGLPVRGYGVMLMIATVAAVGLAAYRARQVGLDPEIIYSLAIAMFIAGILGARLFYVIEYWDREFSPDITGNATNTLMAIANIPKGGLVVYGSVLGGVPAGIWYCLKRGLSPLLIGDIIAPSMLVGQALGRVGCFLNGCCFGSVCLTAPYAVTFPASSPPYVHHEQAGWHTGVWLTERDDHIVVGYVAPRSAANAAGLKEGDLIQSINGAVPQSIGDARLRLFQARGALEIATDDGRVLRWLTAQPPPRSVPVHAAQIYAALDAGLLALLLWTYFPFRTRDGQVFALMLVTHPLSRFLIEMIRDDEPGRLGTQLTISQWLSILIFLAGIALWLFILRRPASLTNSPRPMAP